MAVNQRHADEPDSAKTPPRYPRHHRQGIRAAIATCLLLACSLPMAPASAGPLRDLPSPFAARLARTLSVTDDAQLHDVKGKATELELYEEGTATGTLPGAVRGECNIAYEIVCNVTIYTRLGAVRGHGTAHPHNTSLYESFAGTLTISGGTGRYTHAHGHAGLYGVFNRRTYALTVQTAGSLAY